MDTPELDFRRFVRLSLATFVGVLLVAASFNYFVDPYDLFGAPRVKGFNALKPTAGKHIRLSKPFMVSRFSPRTVIGGNSRPELGLDPLNACWKQADQPVFNMGIPGADIFMQARMLQHAMAVGPKGDKQIFWGLDFMDFLDRRPEQNDWASWPRSAHEYEKSLAVTASGQVNEKLPWNRFKKYATTLFSIDALNDSAYTLLSQGNANASTRRRDGFNPARDYIDAVALEGQNVLFRQKNRELAKIFARNDLSLFGNGRQWSHEFETVSRTLEYLKKSDTKVTLFINPYHANYLALIALSGRWPEFEQWKYQLQRLANEHGVDLWDFAVFNDYTQESLPVERNSKRTLYWFWEPAHYKAKYGDLMLRQLLGASCPEQDSRTVGIRLTSGNIESHLEHERDAMALYRKLQAESIDRLEAYLPGKAADAKSIRLLSPPPP